MYFKQISPLRGLIEDLQYTLCAKLVRTCDMQHVPSCAQAQLKMDQWWIQGRDPPLFLDQTEA